MRVIDISIPIHPEMLTYPGDPVVSITRASDMERGEHSNLSVVSMSTHTGTHIDPPLHFVADGAAIDQVPFDVLIGEALVVDMRGIAAIGADELADANIPKGTERLLFLTDRSAAWSEPTTVWPERYTALTQDGASWIVDRGIQLVGIDFLSIEDAETDGGTSRSTERCSAQVW